MLCEKCGKNPATVMYTQIINGRKSSVNICSACAAQESIFENFGSLFSFAPHIEQQTLVCPVCSTTLAEFTKSGRAGCGECYHVFNKYASALLKKIHGTSEHIKSTASESKSAKEKPKNEIDILRASLEEAIKTENFEEAALLRDKIRDMEKGDNK